MKKNMFSFVTAVFSGALSYSVLIIFKFYFKEDLHSSDKWYALVSIGILLTIAFYFLISYYGWWLAKMIFKERLNKEISDRVNAEFEKIKNDNGLIKIYPNMDSCMSELCEKLKTEENIAIFIQIGTQILTGKGKFYDCLKFNPRPKKIRILHSSVRTVYLSSKKAEQRGKGKLEEWNLNLKTAESFGKQLASLYTHGIFEARAHHEGYYWRIFLFDNECYVQPYIHESNNSSKAPVFLLKNKEDSIYHTFKNYFNNKWEEYKPNTYYVNDFVKESFPVTVTSILKFNSLFIFIIPKRYVNLKKNEMYVHAVGGKTEENETYKSALIREAKEEINVDISVFSSNDTLYMNTSGKQLSATFKDDPAPAIIYRRDDIKVKDKRVKWILIYRSELNIQSLDELSPQNEIEAILCLSREMLMKIADENEKVTIRDINLCSDSRLISNNNFASYIELKPEGMLSIIANSKYINN